MSKARWGLAAFYAVMLIATLVVSGVAGQRATGLYWIVGVVYALRGDIAGLRKFTLWVLYLLGAAFLIWIVLLQSSGPGAGDMALDFFLAAVTLIGIYAYLRNLSGAALPEPRAELPTASGPAASPSRESHAFDSTAVECEPTLRRADEELWASALTEYAGEARRHGLYAQLYSQYEGNAERIKSAYLRHRVGDMRLERDKAVASALSNFECLSSHQVRWFKVLGFTCGELANGKLTLFDRGAYYIYPSQKDLVEAANARSVGDEQLIDACEGRIEESRVLAHRVA